MADTKDTDQKNEADRHQAGSPGNTAGSLGGTRDDARAEPSGYHGGDPSTAGPGQTRVASATPDNAVQQLNPSSPGDTGTTPGTNAELG